MATRKEIHRSKLELKNYLRLQCSNGHLLPGAPTPSLRDMAETYGISAPTVTQALQELVDEGLLHTIPRVGTFVGPQKASFENYLLLDNFISSNTMRNFQFWMGFEARIAQLGGVSIKMSVAQLTAAVEARTLPPLCGMVEMDRASEEVMQSSAMQSVVARVRFATYTRSKIADCDYVSFDDLLGGRQATQHLLSLGHKRVAFLGLHAAQSHDTSFNWSHVRENGWREAMLQAGLPCKDSAFSIREEPGDDHFLQREAALTVLRALIARADITAVVAANDQVAIGLLHALRTAQVPPYQWPSIVGFDDDPVAADHLVTSLRLSWEEMGRGAANLLWERRHGRLKNTSTHQLIPMRLIPRLTCRINWSTAAGTTVLDSVAA